METLKADAVIAVLRQHIGRNNGLKTCDLVELATGKTSTPRLERFLRQVIRRLREEGWPICGTPESGYFWASDPEDMQKTCDLLRSRAISSLALIGKIQRLAMPGLSGQLSLFPDLTDPKIPEIIFTDYSQMPKVNVSIKLPKSLHEAIEEYCEQAGTDKEHLLGEALSSFLFQQGVQSAAEIYKYYLEN